MNTAQKEVVQECSRLSDAGGTPFPEIVGKLIAAGVERYHADLVRHEKTYYWPDGGSECVHNDTVEGLAAATFTASAVADAVRASQAGAIKYKEFCARVIAAGCVGYHVHIAGKRVVYYGRSGDSHTEWFPGAKP